MFQFTRNNQIFKCSPIVLEGFEGDSDSGFICTNTKENNNQNIENFENSFPGNVTDQIQKIVVNGTIKNYDQCVQDQTVNNLANANKLPNDDGAANNTRYAMCAPYYNNPGWAGGANKNEDRKDAFKYAPARFARIEGGSDYLQLSQVVVKDVKGVNVAKGKSVSSSGFCCDGNEFKAVDGVESARGHPNEFHSNGGNAFFEIDLGAPVEISTVTIYNRADCCQGRLASGYKVKLLDAARNVVFTGNNLNGDSSQTVVVRPPVFEKKQCPEGQTQSGFTCYPPFLINK